MDLIEHGHLSEDRGRFCRFCNEVLFVLGCVVVECANCGAENPAGKRFCGDCGSPLALLCAACGAENPPGKRFCGDCGAALVEGSAQPPARDAPVAERRLVSVLFADLVGFTPLSESRDPEEVRELLSQYFDTCRRLVEIYGGVVEKFIGDAVMAVGGTPTAQEDDAERAVCTALDLVAAVTALEYRPAEALAAAERGLALRSELGISNKESGPAWWKRSRRHSSSAR